MKPPKPITCNRCQKPNLNWKQVDRKWRLHEGDKLHCCVPLTENQETKP